MNINRKGFTLVELLATIIILAILVTIGATMMNKNYEKTKEKTEETFVKTVTDAIEMYIDTDARKLTFNTSPTKCINKTHKLKVKLYKNTGTVTFANVINSELKPITEAEFANPASEGKSNYKCSTTATLEIFRDEDYVYYYRIAKSALGCLNDTSGNLTNLPTLVNCS